MTPRAVFKSQKMIAMRFLNASVLGRKALNRNLSWGFPLGNLLPKTRVSKHRVLERKRRPFLKRLGTLRFRTQDSSSILAFEQCQMVVFVADDLGFLGPRIPDLVTELCPPQNTA